MFRITQTVSLPREISMQEAPDCLITCCLLSCLIHFPNLTSCNASFRGRVTLYIIYCVYEVLQPLLAALCSLFYTSQCSSFTSRTSSRCFLVWFQLFHVPLNLLPSRFSKSTEVRDHDLYIHILHSLGQVSFELTTNLICLLSIALNNILMYFFLMCVGGGQGGGN